MMSMQIIVRSEQPKPLVICLGASLLCVAGLEFGVQLLQCCARVVLACGALQCKLGASILTLRIGPPGTPSAACALFCSADAPA